MRLDRDLVSVHSFGNLCVALYDGRLLCVAIALSDGGGSERRRQRESVPMRAPVVSWAGG